MSHHDQLVCLHQLQWRALESFAHQCCQAELLVLIVLGFGSSRVWCLPPGQYVDKLYTAC